jgi:hypothetical protein
MCAAGQDTSQVPPGMLCYFMKVTTKKFINRNMYHDNKTTKQVRTTKFFGLQINNLIKLVNIHTVYG